MASSSTDGRPPLFPPRRLFFLALGGAGSSAEDSELTEGLRGVRLRPLRLREGERGPPSDGVTEGVRDGASTWDMIVKALFAL